VAGAGEDCIMRSFITCEGDQVKEVEMSISCSTREKYEYCIQNIGRKILKGKDHSEDLGIVGKIILERIFGK
jgi:hypothetical protein